MRLAGASLLSLALLASAGRADAMRSTAFDIAPGSLQAVAVAVGTQADVTIGVSDPSIMAVPVKGVRGRMSVAAALSRMLAGTAADYRRVDAATFRIVRRRSSPPTPTGPPPPMQARAADQEIVVTGSKRAAAITAYPGSVALIDAPALRPIGQVHGSQALVDQLPILTSTNLGPGRDKLFIRGVADSSFNGPTQATVGEYLGEIRLNYNAPDPDLALYDMAAVEILEGPQGTLYGAGSLGGIVRLVPSAPDLGAISLELAAGGSAQAHGAPGGDGAAVLNLPLIRDRLGLRVVGYGAVDGGYIDDPSRGRSDINRTTTRGLRATARYRPAADWTIDFGAVLQGIDSRDGQYAERGLPPLQRSSVLAQPFDNDYALGSVTVRRAIGQVQLVSATSIVRHEVNSTYDASRSTDQPRLYQERNHITLVTSETRLSRSTPNGNSWVVGVELLRSGDRLTRTFGVPRTDDRIAGTDDVVEEGSLFGEGTLHLAGRWFATGGARLELVHHVDHALDQPDTGSEPHRHATALLPSAGLTWKASGRLSLYGRYEQGFRPGGLSVQGTVTQRFESDDVRTYEAGLRLGGGSDRFTATAAGSLTHWEDIQADLVDGSGLPYTTNIGTGRILGIEARASWRPVARLTLDAGLFADRSRLSRPAPGFTGERDARLPNIPAGVGRLGARYDLRLAGREIALSGSVRYVGRSRLGVGTVLDLRQGRTVDTAAGISLPLGRVTATLDATNLLDTRGNIFALGNPFGVTSGDQITPQRPRTVRLGASTRF